MMIDEIEDLRDALETAESDCDEAYRRIEELERQLAEARELLLGVQPTEQQQPSWYERRDALLKALAGEESE